MISLLWMGLGTKLVRSIRDIFPQRKRREVCLSQDYLDILGSVGTHVIESRLVNGLNGKRSLHYTRSNPAFIL